MFKKGIVLKDLQDGSKQNYVALLLKDLGI